MKNFTKKLSAFICAALLLSSAMAFAGDNDKLNTTTACTITVKSSKTNSGCYGLNNGSTIITPTGTSPYTFSWSSGTTVTAVVADSATGLAPATYTINVTDNAGCTGSTTVKITQPSQLRDSIPTPTAIACYGGTTNATLDVKEGTGFTFGFTYSWTNGTTTQIAALTAGTYTAYVTDKNGCKDSAMVTLTQPTQVKDSITVVNVACYGGKTGSATVVSTTGGTSPYTYTWNTTPPSTATTVTGLSAGSYTLSTRDKNNCTVTNTVTVTQPASALTVSATSTVSATCGQSNGVAYATVSGGTTPYGIVWSPSGNTNDTAKGLAAGSYTVNITDANGCTANASTSVANNSTLAATISSTIPVSPCYGDSNGAITGAGTGGTPNYTYSWSNGQTNATISNLKAGIYTLTVTDANKCVATTTDTVKQPTRVAGSISKSTSPTCYGDSNGTATATATGGTGPYTFTWSTGVTASSVSNLKAGTYTITVNDNVGCSGTFTFNLTQPAQIRDSISKTVNVACYGGKTGNATVGVTGGTPGYTYLWSTGATATSSTLSGSTFNNNQAAGTYTVIVTDKNGCKDSAIATIAQPSKALHDSIRDSIMVMCYGNKTGSASVGVTGGTPGYTYRWRSGTQTTDTATGLGAGTYTVTVTDANKCTTTATVVITQPASALTAVDTSHTASCGQSNGSVMVVASGGTPGYTYKWTPNTSTADSAFGLAQGIYSCTVTDANGCAYTVSATVANNTTLKDSLVARSNVTPCFGDDNGTVTFRVTGGTSPYTFSWSPTGGTDTIASNLASGTYTFTATDNSGCKATDTVIITRPTKVTANISASTNLTCNGSNNGRATVTAGGGAGGYTYSWSSNPVQTTATATGLAAGTYTITVMDSKGCSAIDSVTLTQPSALRDSIRDSINVTCYLGANGSASVGVKGGTPGYTYLWTSAATTDTASNLAAGSYTVTIRDKNNCTATASVIISQPSQLRDSVASTTNVMCYGNNTGSATIGVKGGTSSYTFTWSPTVSTNATANNLPAGNYTVTVKDANGCTGNTTATVTITQPKTALADSSKSTTATCAQSNGSATVFAYGGTGGYTYSWSNSATASSISAVAAGSYTCTVTDGNGCTVSPVILVANNSSLAGNLSLVSNVTCNGTCNGSASVTASGGSGSYSYAWTGGATATSASNLCAGLNSVQITDGSGCTTIDTITITQPQPIVVVIDSTIAGGCNNTATAKVTGGTGAYIYNWSTAPVQTIATATGLCAGTTYTVTVTDGNNCTASATIGITNPTGIAQVQNTGAFNVYPVPANNTLNISLGGFNAENLKVYDITGRELISQTINPSATLVTIDVSKLDNGTYVVGLTNGTSQKLARFIVVK